MLVRLIGAFAAALALAVALPAVASAALSRPAQRVYDDYRSDAAIVVCDHTVADYRRTLREITPAIEEESPAFRPAVEAALQDRREGKKGCKEGPAGGSGSSGGGGGGATTGGGISKGGVVSPPKTIVPPVHVPAKPKPLPVPARPAPVAPVAPAKPAPTAQATPAPTVAPPPPVTSSAPAPAKEAVLVDRPHQGTPAGLLIALGLLALALVCALLALAAGRFGLGGERMAGARHAWGEAAYRATGTWADFVDWVRLGR